MCPSIYLLEINHSITDTVIGWKEVCSNLHIDRLSELQKDGNRGIHIPDP